MSILNWYLEFFGRMLEGMQDSFQDSFFMGCLMVVAVIVAFIILVVVPIGLIWLVAEGVFIVLDSWFVPEREAVGEITRRHHSDASTTLMPAPVIGGSGGVVLTPTHVPESWGVSLVLADGRTGYMSCSSDFYRAVDVGTQVAVQFKPGRLRTRHLYFSRLTVA